MDLFHPKTRAELEKQISTPQARFCSCAPCTGQVASWSIVGHNQFLHFGLSSDVRGGLKGTVVSICSDFLCLTYVLGFPPVFLLKAYSCGWSRTWVCSQDLRRGPVSVTGYWQQLTIKVLWHMERLPGLLNHGLHCCSLTDKNFCFCKMWMPVEEDA